MNKNGARRKNARRAHMHEALWCVLLCGSEKERCCFLLPINGPPTEWVEEETPSPRRNLEFLVRMRRRDWKIYAACIYITSISLMILYINSTSANICPALMNCMDFLIQSLSLFLEERQRRTYVRLKLIRQTSLRARVSVYIFIYRNWCLQYLVRSRPEHKIGYSFIGDLVFNARMV